MSERISERKKALLALKEEILSKIKHYEKCIEVERCYKKDSSYYEDDDSDSDTDLMLDTGPPISQLKVEEDMLQTCLHATQELTNLYVLQSQVNVMLEQPVLERETPVTEEGTWREVTAECRVDLVPFTIVFYAHQPERLFGPVSYRGLRVQPVKAVHENELNKSILSQVTTPSDAVEVLRSYALAHRERRTILARLAEKYPSCLFMEPMSDGGYLLKCANLLEVSWSLVNKWSPVAAFHHKMKFNLEYMDETYVKIISQAYKKLSDPAIEMEERMRLMNRIIATCLEAQGPTQELYESMESDLESENLRKRRTTLDEEIEEPVHKKQRDSDVMAPPKSLPKKTKPKGKENKDDNENQGKATKRSVGDNKADGAKRAKLAEEGNIINKNGVADNTKNSKENVAVTKNLDGKNVVSSKNIAPGTKFDEKNVAKSKNTKSSDAKKNVAGSKNSDKAPSVKTNVAKSTNVAQEVLISKGGVDKNIADIKKSNSNVKKTTKVVENTVNKDSGQVNNETQSKTYIPLKITKEKNTVVNNMPKQSKGKSSVQNSETKAQIHGNNFNKDSKSNNRVDENIPKAKSTSNVNENIETDNVKNLETNKQTNKNNSDEINTVGKSNKANKVATKNIPKAKSASNVNENIRTDNAKNLETNKQTNENNSNEINTVGKSNKANKVATKNIPKAKSTSNVNENVRTDNAKNLETNKQTNENNSDEVNTVDKSTKVIKVVTKNIPKAKSTSNVNENVRTSASDNVANIKNKGKSIDRPKSANHKELNVDNTNSKNDVNLQKNSMKPADIVEKVKGKSDTNVKYKPKDGVINKKVAKIQEKSNKEVINQDNNAEVNTENLAKVAKKASQKQIVDKMTKIIKNPKLTNNIDKSVKNRNSLKSMTNSKKHDTLQKVVVRSSVQSRNSDKLSEIHDENNATKNIGSFNNVGNIDVATANNLATNNKTKGIINKDTKKTVKDDETIKNKPKTNVINKNILNSKNVNKTQNIAKISKIIQTKSPKQKNKIVLLNPRNRKSLGNLKANNKYIQSDTQKESAVQTKNTKIPQRLELKHVRGDINNRPMRVSPRKMQSNLRVDSQNMSKSSQISLQKPITGIPRLMKKPVTKAK